MKFIPEVANRYLSTQGELLAEDNLKMISLGTASSSDIGFEVLLKYPLKADAVLGPGKSSEIVRDILFYEQMVSLL